MIARENDPSRHTKPVIYTIGHSTRLEEEFLAILKAHSIELVTDVRSIPKSRHNPQFNSEAMAMSLPENGIAYEHVPKLGGLRHPRRDSPNMGWENASFRGFADYMQTTDFEEGLEDIIAFAQKKKTAIMCAEAAPWRCHRSLIGDALLVRGITVIDIMSASSFKVHMLTPWAKVLGTIIIYPKN
jgi:uncharacterized protein (DUF488 family)